jgi:ribonuclease E
VLRPVEEEAGKERSAQIRTIVPVEIATYLLNEKRRDHRDEQRKRLHVMIPNPNMETPHFEVLRLVTTTRW